MTTFKQYSVIRSFAATTADGKPVMVPHPGDSAGNPQPDVPLFITRDNAWRIHELEQSVIDKLIDDRVISVADVATEQEAKYPAGSTRDPREVYPDGGTLSPEPAPPRPARPSPAPARPARAPASTGGQN